MKKDKVIIIAEAGVNHNGDYELAKKMVVMAKKAGADYVKFQTAVPELVVSKYATKAEYQLGTTNNDETQLEMTRKIHLPLSDYKPLKLYCDEIGIKFLSTPFDLVSIDLLSKLNMDFFKMPSGEITNLPYLRKVAQNFDKIIMSTGMASMDEIKKAFNVFLKNGIKRDNIIILHCNTEYPTPMEDVNLMAMIHIQKELGTNVGYSDHTLGTEVSIAAVALGAKVIEKHFTLDRNFSGPDHKASLEPNELKAMITAIRNIEKAISGSGFKEESPSEAKNKPIARKSITASRIIKKGEIFNENNLTVKRPGIGINPMRWDEIIGKTAIKDFQYDDLIEII